MWSNFLWLNFWDRLTAMLKVTRFVHAMVATIGLEVTAMFFSVFFKDLRLLLCSFLFFFKENYLLSFLLWELLLISYCFSCVLFRCFFFHKKNYLLSFLLQELLLIYCNNMITRAVLKNKGLIFIYFFLIFLSNFLWYDFDFVCFCGGFRGGEKGEGWL